MKTNSFIENRLSGIKSLMQKHRIKRAYLFGSAVKGNFGENSDVDFVVDVDDTIEPVELGGHLWDLTFELEKLLGREVDLLTSRSLKNPYFIEEINETKQLIYG